MQLPRTSAELDDLLSTPSAAVMDSLRDLSGDLIVLGAGGKMGPTLARMARRALPSSQRVIAVSRFSSASARAALEAHGVECVACDLMDRAQVVALPYAANVIYMAGQKFGTADAPALTWAMNTLAPAHVAERYARSRIVVFSTGCVYPLVPIAGPGADEASPLEPLGEYANSCVGRERVFEHIASQHGTELLMFRLCYAIDLRYGVLCDVATRVLRDEPVDLSMGVVQVIWQGDANARALQCLAHTSSPPSALNVTGGERIAIRWLAEQFAQRFGRAVSFTGNEGSHAWLWDVSRADALFGPPSTSLAEMIDASAHWLRTGGETLGKPTHFEVTHGRF